MDSSADGPAVRCAASETWHSVKSGCCAQRLDYDCHTVCLAPCETH